MVDFRHAGHRSHGARERQRVVAVPPHSHVERPQPAQPQPRVEWPERRAGARGAGARTAHRCCIADDDAGHQVGVSAQIFRRAVHHDSCPELERAA